VRFLFLSSWYPFPAKNGSELRILNLLAALAERHEVTLLALREMEGRDSGGEPIPGVRVRTVPRRPYRPGSLRALSGLVRPVPRSLVDTYVPALGGLIREELAGAEYDLVIASEMGMSAYHPMFVDMPSIFEDVELGIYRSQGEQATNFLSRWRHVLSWIKLGAYLRRVVPRFSASTVVSQEERNHLEGILRHGHRIEIVPNGIRLQDYEDVETKGGDVPTLIYTGAMSYIANFDAMCWFVAKIFPVIKQAIPSARLLITGNPGERSLPRHDGVELTGQVADIRPLVASADVSVVPLRLGGGTRLKVLEAMALGTAVVSTRKGAEGLAVAANTHLLVEDAPKAFAEAVVRLLRDKGLRRELTANARRLVAEKYDWPVILPTFVHLAEEVAGTRSTRSPNRRLAFGGGISGDGPTFAKRPAMD
jgi:polysaccharide biosynthesis protein PslH